MSVDKQFTKDSTYRDVSDRDLYYDLGYQVAMKDHSYVETNSFILYLVFISLLLNFFFLINQILTLVVILFYGLLIRYGNSSFDSTKKAITLILMLGANILDHTIGGHFVQPGSLVTGNLTIVVWILEVAWILFYGVEFLSLFAPVQEPSTEGRTVIPVTEETERNYSGLKQRIAGSEYAVTNFEKEVDTSLLQVSFRNIIQYLILTFIGIVLIDLFIWQIISGISGGRNVNEAYLVSGVSFVIYLAIALYSGNFFRDDKSSNKNE